MDAATSPNVAVSTAAPSRPEAVNRTVSWIIDSCPDMVCNPLFEARLQFAVASGRRSRPWKRNGFDSQPAALSPMWNDTKPRFRGIRFDPGARSDDEPNALT